MAGSEHHSPDSMQWTGGICGINNPIGATRKSKIFFDKVKLQLQGKEGLTLAPYVDESSDLPLPSGLAGNSAYVIKPWAAKKLLEKTAEVGIWPNDALMCRQFFPWLQVSYPFYTTIQNTPSTTTS
jgi:GR25 family glycosyltransferase involved in LPS biosynthesis